MSGRSVRVKMGKHVRAADNREINSQEFCKGSVQIFPYLN